MSDYETWPETMGILPQQAFKERLQHANFEYYRLDPRARVSDEDASTR